MPRSHRGENRRRTRWRIQRRARQEPADCAFFASDLLARKVAFAGPPQALERRQSASGIDEEFASSEAVDLAILDPLLGSPVQQATPVLPVHEMPSALDLESQLVVVP